MATKRAATSKKAEEVKARRGFGKKVTKEDVKKAVDIRDEADPSSGGSKDNFSMEKGENLFWLMPPMGESDLPWRSLNVHYNPFHVCRREPPVVKVDPESGEVSKAQDSLFGKCLRCQLTWDKYGFDKDIESNEEWKASSRFDEFKKGMSVAKTLFNAIPVNAFYDVDFEVKGKRKIVTVSLKENGQELWNSFEKAYMAYTKSEKFTEKSEEGISIPGFKFEVEDKGFITGVQNILFSWDYWNLNEDGTPFEDIILDKLTDDSAPWATNDEGNIASLIMITKRQTDPKKYDTISYSCEVVEFEEEDQIVVSDEFLEFLGEFVPDLEEIFVVPEDDDIRKIMKESSERSGKLNMQQAPECFADPKTFDAVMRDECAECPYNSACARAIRDGKTRAEVVGEAPSTDKSFDESEASESKTASKKETPEDVLNGDSVDIDASDIDDESDDEFSEEDMESLLSD